MNGAAGSNAWDPTAVADAGREPSRHADLQALVLDASTTLTSANPDELDTKLRWTLGSVATGLDADYAAVYGDVRRADEDDAAADATGAVDVPEVAYESVSTWSRDGDAVPGAQVDIDTAFGPLLARVREEGVLRIARIPEDAAPTPPGCAELHEAGVESVLAVPVVRDWELWGVLVFAAGDGRERWNDREVVLVRSLADMIANSLERVERERRLAAQNERLEEFASVVTHDLRNPLNVVLGSIDLAEQTGDPEHFARARRAAGRMDGIIDTVLGLARAGRDIGDTEPVGIDRVAVAAWDAVDTAGAALDVDGPGRVDGDEDRLVDALSNLFRNAIEHGGDDVRVTVGERAACDGFYVADDGAGLPGDADSLFERGRSGDGGGTGIGLTIVRQVVEAHGWTVEAGESVDGGARFDVIVDG